MASKVILALVALALCGPAMARPREHHGHHHGHHVHLPHEEDHHGHHLDQVDDHHHSEHHEHHQHQKAPKVKVSSVECDGVNMYLPVKVNGRLHVEDLAGARGVCQKAGGNPASEERCVQKVIRKNHLQDSQYTPVWEGSPADHLGLVVCEKFIAHDKPSHAGKHAHHGHGHGHKAQGTSKGKDCHDSRGDGYLHTVEFDGQKTVVCRDDFTRLNASVADGFLTCELGELTELGLCVHHKICQTDANQCYTFQPSSGLFSSTGHGVFKKAEASCKALGWEVPTRAAERCVQDYQNDLSRKTGITIARQFWYQEDAGEHEEKHWMCVTPC